jgi:O-antigen chain-terminating methyltransferase
MRRTIEKLAQERKEKEDNFSEKLKEIREKSGVEEASQKSRNLDQSLSRLKEILESETKAPQPGKKGALSPFSKGSKMSFDQSSFNRQVLTALNEFRDIILCNSNEINKLAASTADLFERQSALTDAKDKEWDALGSNHVGLIFKSMEWRVDKLAAESEDANILMKKFLLLKEKLTELTAAIEDKKLPSPALVKDVLAPLEDWRYTGFENRFRGFQEEIRKQQKDYLPYFKEEGKVLDLGCGRGEFLELLRENGIEASGVDLNQQMVEICLDKGLPCERGDLLEKLAEAENGSLAGIFCSQVIEHLPPAYMRRMIDLAYFKLGPGGTIILETINPASLFALAEVFFLDLTHQKPVHPLALRFLLETSGFEDVGIKYSAPLDAERLENLPGADEKTSLLNRNIDRLNKLLYSSLNYAAIGKKK